MGFMQNKSWLSVVALTICFACSVDNTLPEMEFDSLPQINVTKSKSIEVNISECFFMKENPRKNTLLSAKVEENGVKLLILSELSCDFANGVYLKEIENSADVLSFNLFQKGTRLSNECTCYFYYQLTLRNANQVPKSLFIGNEPILESNSITFNESEWKEIENKLTN